MDEAPSPTESWQGAFATSEQSFLASLVRFRVAHEFAHTFFYRRGVPPRRAHHPGRVEEQFCDRFAAALLVRPSDALTAHEIGAAEVVALATKAAVPLFVALDAVVIANPRASYFAGVGHFENDSLTSLRVYATRGFANVAASWAAQVGDHDLVAEKCREEGIARDFAFFVAHDSRSVVVSPLYSRNIG